MISADEKRMNIRFLGYLIRVAELESFHLTGLELGITSSAISQAMQALEEDYGAELIMRLGRNTVGLTRDGYDFLPVAREIFRLATVDGMVIQNTKYLPYFLAAARSPGIREAVDRFGISKSCAYSAIRALEHQLQAKLFEGRAHETRLTEAGRQLVPIAERIVLLEAAWVNSSRKVAA